MMLISWSSIDEVPYCFSRSSVKFQGHTGQKIANFDPNLAFLDCYCSLNSQMCLKWCTKLDVVQKGCPNVFRGHPSNLKVTWTEKSMIWIQFKAKLLGRSQLSNPSDLPCFISCDQAALRTPTSVCPSVCPSVYHTFFTMFLSCYHHKIFRIHYQWQKWCPGKRSRS